MKLRAIAAIAISLGFLGAAVAIADNYPVKDGTGALQVFASKLVAGVQYPFQIASGLVNGTGSPSALNVDAAGNVGSRIVATTGVGATPYNLSGGSTSSTNATLIGAGPRTLYGLTLVNTTMTVYYVRLYDTQSVDCSSATGARHSYPVPGGSVVSPPMGAPGEAYQSGIGFCITAGGGDTNTSAAAAGVWVNASYK